MVSTVYLLDSPTLLITQAVLQWAMAVLLLIASPRQRSEHRWAFSLIVHGLGNVLLFVRPLMPHAVAIISYNLCVAVAFSMSHYALSFLVKKTIPWWQFILPSLLSPLLMGLYLDDIQMRIIIASFLGSVQVVLMTAMLVQGAWPGSDKLKHAMVSMTALFAFGLFLRGVFSWLDPAPFTQLLGRHPVQAMLIFIGILYCIITTVIILLSHLEELNQNLSDQAAHDNLTGILNRGAFMAKANSDLAAQRYPACVLMLDLDYFKQINDRYGHAVGDLALSTSARVLNSCLRASDTLGRLGGEEFGIILPNTSLDQAMEIAERLRAGIAEIRLGASNNISMSISIGVATALQMTSIDQLLHAADTALYQAKLAGRNCVRSAV